MNEQHNLNNNKDNYKEKRHDFERNFAIVIGINKYDEKNKPLKLAVPDAELMEAILSSSERTKDEFYDVLLLKDQDATQDKINKLLDNLQNGKIVLPERTVNLKENHGKRVLPEETVDLKENHRILFYFSGHGYASIRETNQPDENEQFLLCQDGNRLPMQRLTTTLGQLPCRHKLLILDCCYSGAICRTSTAEIPGYRTASFDDDGMSFRADYDRMWKNPTFTVITSAGYELALDSDNKEQKNSYFAMALCEAIECRPNGMEEGSNKADFNKDSIITAQELCTYIQNQPQVISRQLPQIYSLTSSEQTPGGQYIFLLPDFEPSTLKKIEGLSSPYKGLLSYEEKDRPIFCGRKKFITQLLNTVCTNNQKLTVVTGASGAGKSSLVKAGLIPRLESQSEPKWLSCEFRPGSSPFKAFCDKLIGCLNIKDKNDSIETKIKSFEQELQKASIKYKQDVKAEIILKKRKINKGFQEVYQEFINLFSKAKDQNVLIAIDQFEELITLCQIPEKELFLELLNEILTQCDNVRLVVTVRSDFETHFQQSLKQSKASKAKNPFNITDAWNNKGVRLYVEDMNSHQLKQVIERPAALFYVNFESESLVSYIIEQVVGRPGALPLLSFVLEQLYQKVKGKSDKKITKDDYDDLGGVIGALQKTADQEYEKLTKVKDGEDESMGELRQQMMKLLMLRMVSLQGGQPAKRPVLLSELEYPEWNSRHKDATKEIKNIREQLEQSRLIVTEAGYTEPAHDALILHWDKLKKWIEEEKDNLILHNRLLVAVEDWQEWEEEKKKNPIVLVLNPVAYGLGCATERVMRLNFWLFQWRNRLFQRLNPLRLVSYVYMKIKSKINRQNNAVQINPAGKSGGHLWNNDPRLELLRELLYTKNSWLNVSETEFVRRSVIWKGTWNFIWTTIGWIIFLIFYGLAAWAGFEGIKAQIKSAEALRESAEAHLGSNRQLEAALEILEAQKKLESMYIDGDRELILVLLEELDNLFPNQDWAAASKLGSSIESTLFKLLYGTQERNRLRLDSGTLYEVVFNPSPNKDQLAATIGDGDIVRLWNSKSKQLAPLITGQKDVYSVAFKYDPKNSNSESALLATGGADGTVKFWEIQNDDSSVSCEPINTPNPDSNSSEPCSIKSIELSDKTKIIDDIEFSADGNFVAIIEQNISSSESHVRLWQLVKPDQNQNQKENRTYTVEELKNFPSTLLGKEKVYWDMAFSPQIKINNNDVTILATVGEDDVVKLWDIPSGNELGQINTKQGSVYSVAFGNDGTLMTGGTDGTVKQWKINTPPDSSDIKIVEDSPNEIKTDQIKNVYSIAVSNDGKVATVGENEVVQLWDRNGKSIPSNIQPLEGSLSDSQTRGVVFSPDGKQMATLGSDNTVRLWDTSGKRLFRFHTYDDETYDLAFSSDGKILATVGSINNENNNNIRLFNPASGETIDYVTTERNFTSLIFLHGANSKEEQLAAIDDNGAVVILTINKDDQGQVGFALGKDAEPIVESIDSAESGLKLDREKIKDLTFSPDGSYVAIVKKDDGTVELREPDKPVPSTPNISNVNSVAISPDNQKIVTAGEDGIVRIWNFEDWLKSSNSTKPIELNAQQGSISRLTFNPQNSNQLVTGGEDGTVRLWDLSKNEPTQAPLLTSDKLIVAAASADGTRLATLSTEGVINLWDEEGDEFKESLLSVDQLNEQRKKALKEAQTITLSSTGKYIAIIGKEGNLLLWNVENDSLADFIQADENNKVKSVAFSPDDTQLLAIQRKDQKTYQVLPIKVHDIVSNQEENRQFEQDFNEGINPCNLFSSTSPNRPNRSKDIYKEEDIVSTSFNPCGSGQLATLSEDGTVKLWNAQGKYIDTLFKTDQKNPRIIAFSPDGKLLATGAAEDEKTEGTVRVWDIKGAQIQQFRVELGDVKSVTFSPDAEHLAIIAKEENSNNPEKFNSLLFDVHDDSRQPINPSNTQQEIVANAIFTSDGNLATLNSNGQLSLWHMSDKSLREKVCQLVWNYLQNNHSSKQNIKELCPNVNEPLTNNFSTGERLLIQSNFSIDKLAGIQAITAGDLPTAIKFLEASLKSNSNDPEALIYLNNAQVGTEQSYTIAVPVPIQSNPDAALEILRGVAQAQDEINKEGRINGVPLKVLIADDQGNPEIATKIAEELVNKPEVLGVVGHYSSDVALKVREIYEEGLPAIFPVSTSVELSKPELINRFTFRTVPSDQQAANKLAKTIKTQKIETQKIAIFYNSESNYSTSLKSAFADYMNLDEKLEEDKFYNLYQADFKGEDALKAAIENGVQALVLFPDTATLDKALEVVKVNKESKNPLPVFGGDDVYSFKTLQEGKESVKGMTVAVPWSWKSPIEEDCQKENSNIENCFIYNSKKLWDADINWRTATSYDATQALIEAIKQDLENLTREGIAEKLRSLKVTGVTGKISFSHTGDLQEPSVKLVEVKSGKRNTSGYYFEVKK